MPELGADVSPLEVHVLYITASIMRIKIGLEGRWEVPESLFMGPRPTGMSHCLSDSSKLRLSFARKPYIAKLY